MKNSLKQLLRRPGRAILFFLLMAASTLLLVFGAAMYMQNQIRIDSLDESFTTVGYISQQPKDKGGSFNPVFWDYGEEGIIYPDTLDFEGADYIVPPESRPYYVACIEGAWVEGGNNSITGEDDNTNLLEFSVKGPSAEKPHMIEAELTKILDGSGQVLQAKVFEGTADSWATVSYIPENLEVGQTLNFVDLWLNEGELEPGKTYVGLLRHIAGDPTWEGGITDKDGNLVPYSELVDYYTAYGTPGTSLVDRRGNPVESVFSGEDNEVSAGFIEVTPDFDESSLDLWNNLIKEREMKQLSHPVLPVSDPNLLTFHRRNIANIRGREITEEEYASGARVCMVAKEFAQKNLLYEGDKITLPLIGSLYGYQEINEFGSTTRFSLPVQHLLDAQGKPLEPFFEAEYEIVGIFDPRYRCEELTYSDLIIVPSRSIEGSDEGHILYAGAMDDSNTSFMIPNGSIEEFDAALREAVPEAERLDIYYDDMGYARSVENLNDAKKTAALLFAVGVLAAGAIIALLLYFFVVMEKKRTAVERSLGMTKGQCRVSLMAGLMVLSLAATAIGSVGAGVLLDRVDAYSLEQAQAQSAKMEEGRVVDWNLGGIYNFSAKYSPWAMWDVQGNKAELQKIEAPAGVFMAAPLALDLLVLLLGLCLIGRSLRIEPLLLLNAKQ
jgi:putative ABC transport system permease protein|nr:FtsX-like permease family protein [Acutalibacter muris]